MTIVAQARKTNLELGRYKWRESDCASSPGPGVGTLLL